ncbi:MAG: Crp/Fnr family transcriptional regulator, partial [Mariprofundaceae bacterium]|nr:Crp/Fnr family transcriptional regulator [Mariprofundaceae bacterium]
ERPHSVTVTAQEELTVLSLKRSYFDLITLEDPLLGNQLLRFMFRLLSRISLKHEVEYAALREYTGSLNA